jgi:hypothetical protein
MAVFIGMAIGLGCGGEKDASENLKPKSGLIDETEVAKKTDSIIQVKEKRIEDISEDYLKSTNIYFEKARIFQEDIPTEIINDWIDSFCPHCDPNEGFYGYIFDLDDDGLNEIMLINGGFCGSAGCFDTYIYQKRDQKWTRISPGFVAISVSTSKGYHDMYDWWKKYCNHGGFYGKVERYKWNGYKYIAIDSMHEQGCLSNNEFKQLRGKKLNVLNDSCDGYAWNIATTPNKEYLCAKLARIYDNKEWDYYFDLLNEFYDSNDPTILSQHILFVVQSANRLTAKNHRFSDSKNISKTDDFSLKVYNYMQDRWDFYERLDGDYYPDFHDEAVLTETAEKFNITTQEALNIFRKIEESRYGL